MYLVIKRNGSKVDFDEDKIYQAVFKAAVEVGHTEDRSSALAAQVCRDYIDAVGDEEDSDRTVEDIQDSVENILMREDPETAKAYILYRYQHEIARAKHNDQEIINMIQNSPDSYWSTENSNKNAKLVTVQRDYLAGITSTDIARRYIFPKDVIEAHDKGVCHQHDMDYMAQETLHNCDLINLEDMLQNGTVINNVRIYKPHRLLTAMTITTQIMASVAANSYGGETITLTHLAPFVRDSYNIFLQKYLDRGFTNEQSKQFAEADTRKEITDAVQTFNHQISTLFTLNGQAPFCSLFMYLNETEEFKEELILLIKEFLRQRIKGMPNRQGVNVTQAFPKILYVLQEDNYKPGTKYWSVTELAIKCSSCRLTPDYISEKVMKQIKVDDTGEGHCFPCMGCRSFLSPYRDKDGNPKYYGRFNCGVSSLNLPDIAFYADEKTNSQERKIQIFFEELDRRAEICHKGLKIRIDRLAKTKAGVAPILWVDGALARKNPDDTLYDLVHGGYATASLGYNGGAETVQILIGESNTSESGQALMLRILQFLSDKCDEWKKQENVAYSLYASPAESLCYKFATKTKERYPQKFEQLFGNKKYFENSYHIPSSEPIDPFSKIEIEGRFQKLSAGGCLSYIESVNLSNNVTALYPILEAIYNNIMYCEINMKTSYCHMCGSEGHIDVHKTPDGNTFWECDICGNRDTDKMDVAARTCGYIGVNWWNAGKTQEIASRYISLDDHISEL